MDEISLKLDVLGQAVTALTAERDALKAQLAEYDGLAGKVQALVDSISSPSA